MTGGAEEFPPAPPRGSRKFLDRRVGARQNFLRSGGACTLSASSTTSFLSQPRRVTIYGWPAGILLGHAGMTNRFNLQGHRGARGLQPENTLPSFETALDLGVTSIETDLHRTRDGVLVLCHDAVVQPLQGPAYRIADRSLTELRRHRVRSDPLRFPDQRQEATPLAAWFAEQHEFDPYAPPTLADLFAFVRAYTGEGGRAAGKTAAQQTRAAQLIFDLELKRVPFRPEMIGDDFDGYSPAELERSLVEVLGAAGVADRTVVRSFDHRCVRVLRQMEPRLTGAVLIAGTAPVEPAELARQADARIYCPEMAFLDDAQVRQCHAAGVQVLPWTANEPDDWRRLLAWGVDGITTDYPDRLAEMFSPARRGVLESFLVPFAQAQEVRWSLCYGVQRFWKSIEAEVDRTHHQGFSFGGHLVTIGMRDLGDQAMRRNS